MIQQNCTNKNTSSNNPIKKLRSVLLILLFVRFFNVSAADTLIIRSTSLPHEDTVLVYSPIGYNNNIPLPAIFLLHGTNGDQNTWGSYLNLEKISNSYHCIIICPDGFNSYYLNSPKNKSLQYVEFFYKDLLPLITSSYPVDTNTIMITGNSMGGFGALNIYAHDHHKFMAVGSISGVVDLNLSAYKNSILAGLLPLTKDDSIPNMYSPLFFLTSINLENQNILIWCGNNDPFFLVNKKMADICKSKEGNVYSNYTLGSHNKQFFSKSFEEQIDVFFKKITPRSTFR